MALVGLTAMANDTWVDTFYQFRLSFTTRAEQGGWQRLPLDETAITDAINHVQRFTYDPQFFAYNSLRLVAVDAAGEPLANQPEGGFYLSPTGPSVVPPIDGDEVVVEVDEEVPYLLSFVSSGLGRDPALKYEVIWPPYHERRPHNVRCSFFPPYLPKTRQRHERLLISDIPQLTLLTGGRFIGNLEELSMRPAEIALAAELPGPGVQHWHLYYQPLGSHHLKVPEQRLAELPATTAELVELGGAVMYTGETRFRLPGSDALQLGYTASTVKLTRDLAVPEPAKARIELAAAANEAESVQLVLWPQQPVAFESLTASDLRGPGGTVAADRIRIRRVAYVPISESSLITPATFLGDMGDPLIEVAPDRLLPDSGAQAFWVTVRVPPGTAAGTYTGNLRLTHDGQTQEIPLALRVRGFELPASPSLRVDIGGQYFIKDLVRQKEEAVSVMEYHGLPHEKEAIQRLSRGYYDLMVEANFVPKSAAMYTEVGLEWTPPPEGYGVDAPGNVFGLHDWDFSAYNEVMRHYIDERGMSTFCIYHTNPTQCHMFMHLPGKRLEEPNTGAPFSITGWQWFRDFHVISYKEVPESYRERAIIVTQKQWDDLVLRWFRAFAENLEANGWLDKAHIMIDETDNDTQLEHFLSLLKSDPLVAQIQVIACVQAHGLLHHKDPDNPERYRFRHLVDTLVPEFDENYDRWDEAYWDDYDIPRDRQRLWMYAVTTSRLAIDTPGVNNRQIGWDIFRRGAGGFLIWETIAWKHLYGESDNPWKNPWTRHANGSLAYFYPPHRDGVSPRPDWTITPSLRLETFRESSEDYEYAMMLEQAIEEGRGSPAAEAVLSDLHRFFADNTNWSQNDAWYLELRERMATAIEDLPAADE